MRSIVIGLVAPKRAGKQTFVQCLLRAIDRNFWNPSYRHFEFSAPIGLALERLGLLKTRQNYQNFAATVEETFGAGTIRRGMELMLDRDGSDLKIADGVRWPQDERLIRSFRYSLLVYITAPPEVRYQRALVAANAKAGEAQMTWEEFLETEKAKTELNIPDIGSRADTQIDNSGAPEELEGKAQGFWEKFLKPLVAESRQSAE